MANTSINCLTSLLEPFGTSDISLTPLHLNVGETMFVQPNIDINITLQGDEDYVYDFDATSINKDVMPVVTNNEPYAVAFPNKGDRYITLSVYDKVPYIDVLLASAPLISSNNFLAPDIVVKQNTDFIYIINKNNNTIKVYLNSNMTLVNTVSFTGTYINSISTPNYFIVLTNTQILNYETDLNNIRTYNFTYSKDISLCDNYLALSNNIDDNVYIYDIVNNTVATTFQTGQGNSAYVSNNINIFYSVNTSTNRIDIVNLDTMDYSFINLSRPTPLSINIYNNRLFVKYYNIVDAYDATNFTFDYSVNTSFPSYFTNILFNSYNDEAILFLNKANKCVISKFDTNTGVISDLQLTINQLTFVPVLNTISNTLTYFYINPLNNTKNVINVSATNFNENYNVQTNTDISNIIQVNDNLSYFYGISEYYTVNTTSTISNRNIRGRMITSATKNFQVYDFPKNIVCVDVAAYQEVLTISVEDDLDAENYTWYVNNIVIGYGKSVLYTYGADIKSTVKCVIKNGYITKTLTKTIILAKNNEANNYRYDSDITPNLVFFNKEGDMINMDYDSSANKWTSELYFDKNSSDTYKTIGINVMESVEPIHLESDNNLLIKNQIFNEYGYEFNNGGYQLEILDYKVVDKKSNTKKIYLNTSKLKKGYEIEISNLYTGTIVSGILTSYTLSELNTSTQTCTILDVTKDYILVYSNTNNAVFNETYIHGIYRDVNNTQITIKKGVVKVNNTIKLRNTSNYNTDWNEPSYINGMYINKPLSIVNPKKSENNRVVYFNKSMDTKYIKQYICDEIPDFGDISFNILNDKIEIGTGLASIIPANFYYTQNIFIWDKTLSKDYTPGLLKKNIRFGFYETNDTYTVNKIDIASNILKPITNNRDGYQIKLSTDFIFDLTIDKSSYNINHNNFPSVTLQEIAKQVSNYINSLDKVTSYYDDISNIIYVYPINSTIVITNIDIKTNIITGCLSNRPNKILDSNNNFVDISSQHYGYTHYDYINESYNIYTQNNEWTIVPKDKKIVLTTSSNIINYSSQEYTGFLDDNIFTISFDESYGSDKNAAISNFVNKNTNVFSTIGLSIFINSDNKLVFEQQLLSPVNVNYIEPLLSYTVNNIGVDIIVLTDKSTLVDETNNDISVLNTKKIVFDNLSGNELVININGIDYKSNIIESTAPNLNLEYSLINWGLTVFEDDKNIIENGTYYYNNLESQGILTWLSKTADNYNILNIETRYPNQELFVNTNQQVLFHDSDIVFNKIVNKLSITISNKIYLVNYNMSIEQTLSDFISKYQTTLLINNNIVLKANNNILSFYTNKDVAINYTIYPGTNEINTLFITRYRQHNMGCVIASNEVRNLTDDLEAYKFSTGMIVNIENSMFYNNNQEYNILYVDNESLVLSYQGAFWRGDDKLGYIYSRKNFEWISFSNLLNTNNTNHVLTGIFTNDNITTISDNYINPSYTVFDPSTNKLIVLHNNGLPQDKASIVDLNTNTIFGSVDLGSEPVYGLYNSELQSVFVVNKNSVKISIIKNGILNDEILIGYQANRVIFDYTGNKIYVSLFLDNSILMIDMYDYNNQNVIYLSPNATPSKMLIDETNRTLYVLSPDDNMIYTIDMEKYMLSGSYNTGLNPIDMKINSNLDIYTANKNDNTITYINNKLAYTINLDSSPLSVAMINDKMFVLTNINKIHVIDTYTNTIIDSIDTINVTNIIAVYFTDKIFLHNNVNSNLGYIDLTADKYTITNINYDSINNTEYTVYLGYTDKAVVATSIDKIHIIEEAPSVTQLQNYSNFVPQSLKIALTTRDFIRYPRERYSDDDYNNITFKVSVSNNNIDIFLYNPENEVLDMLYETEYVIPYLDDISSLSLMPSPLQIFTGFKGMYDTVSNSVLSITRNKHISNTVSSSVLFESNMITIKNFNFIEAGYEINDIIEITNLDGYIENAGLQGKIIDLYINTIVISVINKEMKYENLDTAKIKIEILPQVIAEISLLGETVTEDERYRVHTGNMGCDINREDIYIFKEYDILEQGIDWTFMNSKRKEMLLNRNDIYNYIGSYKALVNSVNYFGYNDISLYEYYYNRNDNTYKKLEIPKIFDKSTQYTSTDYVKQLLPNDKYKKTNLFNLTYDITDMDGNYVLAYSLDEVITKLLGLKKWLQNNVMPLGMRIKDITGVSTTSFSNQLCASNKAAYKYNISDSLTPMDFNVVAILQPLKNNSKTYSIHIDFLNDVSEYFSIKIKTFKDVNSQYRYVQNFSYYKTDNSSINITCDINTDPYIMIETESDNGYGATYNVKKIYSLLSNNFIN